MVRFCRLNDLFFAAQREKLHLVFFQSSLKKNEACDLLSNLKLYDFLKWNIFPHYMKKNLLENHFGNETHTLWYKVSFLILLWFLLIEFIVIFIFKIYQKHIISEQLIEKKIIFRLLQSYPPLCLLANLLCKLRFITFNNRRSAVRFFDIHRYVEIGA